MAKPFFILLLFAFAVYGQEQKRVAILRTVDDGSPEIEPTELIHLTARLREIASNVLQNRYGIMTEQTIIDKLGGLDNAKNACKEAEGCLAKLGVKLNADYIGQARLGRFGGNLTISVELYNSGNSLAIHTISGNAKDIFGLLAVINEKAPEMFRKMPGVSSRPIIEGGQTINEDYEFEGKKRYLANIISDPEGASLSFNGIPDARCTKTPCNVELREGSVRIIANLEQYEIADTTVSIKQNNQSIRIRLKANFGVLEIKPAYSDGIGRDERWSLTINGKANYSWENRLSPNKYKVELSHRCYEAISFEAGINKDRREVFDMAGKIKLKKGGLDLSAEQDGEPVSEPVFVNEIQVGETPFGGSVPLCAKVEIGESRETVDVKLKYKEKVEYVHKLHARKSHSVEGSYSGDSYIESQDEKEKWDEEIMRTAWMVEFGGMLAAGAVFDMENIGPYLNSVQYLWPAYDVEFYKRNFKFFRFGFNFGFGLGGIDEDAVKRDHPKVVLDSMFAIHFHVNTFARLYPVDFLYLSGGVGWYSAGLAGTTNADRTENEKIKVGVSTLVFPVGGGICLGSFGNDDTFMGIFIEGLYNIVPSKGGYISINIGMKGNFRITKTKEEEEEEKAKMMRMRGY
ncbi:MAG: PEGA domain-containing protein [Fibromonadaceae bacterium]|nr:PEGA domain-containing protein [Fibromonadaceae bacterium]